MTGQLSTSSALSVAILNFSAVRSNLLFDGQEARLCQQLDGVQCFCNTQRERSFILELDSYGNQLSHTDYQYLHA
jgi:hypothetical protein